MPPPLIHHTLCISYGYILTLPNGPYRNDLLAVVRHHCRLHINEWIDWVEQLPSGHSVKEDWTHYNLQQING